MWAFFHSQQATEDVHWGPAPLPSSLSVTEYVNRTWGNLSWAETTELSVALTRGSRAWLDTSISWEVLKALEPRPPLSELNSVVPPLVTLLSSQRRTSWAHLPMWVKITAWAWNVGEMAEAVHFWLPLLGSLARWVWCGWDINRNKAHRCTHKAQGFRWSWPRALCLPR